MKTTCSRFSFLAPILLFACAVPGEPISPAEPDRSPTQVPPPAQDPGDLAAAPDGSISVPWRSVELIESALAAFHAGNSQRAAELLEDALVALGPETEENLTWDRVLLLDDIAVTLRHGLDLATKATPVSNRWAAAHRRLYLREGNSADGYDAAIARRNGLIGREAPAAFPESSEPTVADGGASGASGGEPAEGGVDLTKDGAFQPVAYSPSGPKSTVERRPPPLGGGEAASGSHLDRSTATELLDSLSSVEELMEQEDSDSARTAYRELQERAPYLDAGGAPLHIAIRISVALIYLGAGEAVEARRQLESVLADADPSGDDDAPWIADVHGHLASTWAVSGDYARASQNEGEAYRSRRSQAGEVPGRWIESGLRKLGFLFAAGMEDEAWDFLDRLLADLAAHGGGTSTINKDQHRALAEAAGQSDESNLAIDFLAFLPQSDGEESSAGTDGIEERLDRADLSADLGDPLGARSIYERILLDLERTGQQIQDDEDSHQHANRARVGVARTSAALGDFRRAREVWEDLLARHTQRYAPDHPRLQAARDSLGRVLFQQGDLSAAYAVQRSNLESLARTMPGDHAVFVRARAEFILTLEELGRFGEALALVDDPTASAPVAAASGADVDAWLLEARRSQEDCRFDEARELLRRVVDVQRRTLSADDPRRIEALLDLAAVCRVSGDVDEARALRVEAEALSLGTPEDGVRLASRLDAAAESASGASAAGVRIDPETTRVDARTARLTVDVQDPAGIRFVHVRQDGLLRRLDADALATRFDERGVQAQVSIEIEVPAGHLLSTVSVAVENAWREVGDFETTIVWAPGDRVRGAPADRPRFPAGPKRRSGPSGVDG